MRPLKRRAFKLKEFRINEQGEKRKIEGHAAVFNQLSEDLGYYREIIKPGAFTKTIQEADVRALFNHSPMYVLGRTKSGTLTLREDDVGLWFEITPPDTNFANDLLISIERGDITQASFGFEIINEVSEVRDGETVYVVTEVKLWDISPVTFAAYPQTDVSLNSSLQNLEMRLRRGAPLQDEDKKMMQELLELFKNHLSSADENHAEGRTQETPDDSDGSDNDDSNSVEPASYHSDATREISLTDVDRRLRMAERLIKLTGGNI